MLAFGAAILLGICSAAIAWFLTPVRSEATVLLKVWRATPTLTNEMPQGLQQNQDFEIYKRTEAQLIKSHFVLEAVVRNPKVSKLPIVQAQKDPIAWLTSELTVDYPGDAEILRIAMKGDNANGQLVTLVTEVKNSYLEDIVNVEAAERVKAKTKLETSVRTSVQEIEAKSKTLAEMEKRLGAGERAKLQKRIALVRLEELVKRRAAVDSRADDIELQLALTGLHVKAGDKATQPTGPVEADIEELKTQQQALKTEREQLEATIGTALARVEEAKKIEESTTGAGEAVALQKRVALAHLDDLARRRAALESNLSDVELRLVLAQARGPESGKNKSAPGPKAAAAPAEDGPELLKTEREFLQKESARLQAQVQKALEDMSRIDETTSEIEAKKTEIRNLSEITNKMSHELKLWDLNMAMANQRIALIDDTANIMPTRYEPRRVIAAGLAGMIGFSVSLVVIAGLRSRGRRGSA